MDANEDGTLLEDYIDDEGNFVLFNNPLETLDINDYQGETEEERLANKIVSENQKSIVVEDYETLKNMIFAKKGNSTYKLQELKIDGEPF
jgi:hypothetical protein